MSNPPDGPDAPADNQADLGYAQAVKYGKDLARLYTLEKAKRRELELANQKLEAMLETAPNGLAVLDETMTIVQVNPRFEVLVEKASSCIGRPLIEVLPSEELVATLKTVSKEGERSAEIEVTPPGLPNRTLHVIGAALIVGGLGGWVISLHDITERKRLEGLKEEFINIAAHELRTPLAIILGYTSILREEVDSADDEFAAPIMDSIIQAASRLKMVIDELVGFAASKAEVSENGEADRFDLWQVTTNAIGSLQYQADLKNVTLLAQTSGEPLMISGDRVLMAQAVGHLLDNAIKFNKPDGQVFVRASKQGDDAILEVEDTGIGIPHTDLDKIFDMFYQVEEHMTRAEGGLGMGLCNARRVVELHGGQITVESTLGQGSCFRIILPSLVEPRSVPPKNRLDTAHQQTLAYGHDLARAFAAQQALLRRLRQIAQLGNELLSHLEQLSQAKADDRSHLIQEAHNLARQLLAESAVPSGKEKE